MASVYSDIIASCEKGRKLFAVLIDPEKCNGKKLSSFVEHINSALPDFVFVGGSQLTENVENTVVFIKEHSKVPVVLFPGNVQQFTPKADAILFLSLISGRNPDFLIGQQVLAAPKLKEAKIEAISTGYILVDGTTTSSVAKMSKTEPINAENVDLIVNTALAGELLGHKLIYLEAGSGAKTPIAPSTISRVKSLCRVPIIVGGGICTKEQLLQAYTSGADLVVVGNHFESNPQDLLSFVRCKQAMEK
ncbi:MAG: geranylgeranylglyceryl/heptaprenylglyceryl phosphate synthase [Paludibacteraceae bacterium]|nr:geranylgeranylglyceryl/heptaprenylglyceryl phosphate synthase [Paludibacteraceae bacterium]MBO7316030.1 geranylgeranylglyceryl/heptaprenylglyceryl phosphate synthase [Paludibacteraceae bacterium]